MPTTGHQMHELETITIRLSGPEDERALDRLAALDSTERPPGWLLLAEVAGELWAAVEVRSGRAIADPFHPTADLVSLLRLRAARLLDGPAAGRRRLPRTIFFRREGSQHAIAAQR